MIIKPRDNENHTKNSTEYNSMIADKNSDSYEKMDLYVITIKLNIAGKYGRNTIAIL